MQVALGMFFPSWATAEAAGNRQNVMGRFMNRGSTGAGYQCRAAFLNAAVENAQVVVAAMGASAARPALG
jgi:hypothetical protein